MANHRMDPRRLAALVSSLVAELLLSLPHHPSAAATTTTTTATAATAATTTSTLITLLYLLNSSTTTTSLSLLRPPPKRRKLSSSSSSSSSSSQSPAPAAAAAAAAAPGHSLDPFLPFFRMSSASFQWLCGLLDPLLDCRDPVGSPLHLPPDLRLAIALFRLSTASPYSSVASRFRVSLPTARFCTKHLCRVLCTNFRFWLSFPSPIPPIPPSPHFPNCSGIIHSSRFHSIAAQLVVDASCRILSIVAAFHKGPSTSTVLKSSALYKDVEEGKVLNGPAIRVGGEVDVPQYLVGDGGFPLLPWLIVPFLHPAPSSGEEEFNVAIRKMQLPALRTVRSLRNWGVLSKPIEEAQEEEDEEEEDEEEGVKMAVACVGACSILHNALLMREDYSALSDEIEDYSFHEPMPLDYGNHGVDNEAAAIRRALLAHTREVRHSN